MKSKIKYNTMGTLAIITLAAGCKPAERSSGDPDPEISRQIQQVEESTREASDDLHTFTHDQKEAYIASLERRLAALNQNIDELSTRVENSSLAVQEEARPRIAELRTQSGLLHTQLENVKDSSASTWENVKSAASTAYDELKVGFNNTREWVSEKIAP